MNTEKRREILERLAEVTPNPTTELIYSTPFELLIAVILSAQATDKGVNKATVPLFEVANTPETIFALGEEKLKEYIKSINHYKGKAQRIIKTCQIIIERYHSQVPNTREALESLPGVGRKTANIILNTIFGEELIAVDTHIFRVANRTGLASGSTPLEIEKKLSKVTQPRLKRIVHHLILLHGRYTCIARRPKCLSCVIHDLCEYKAKTKRLEPHTL